MRLRHNPKQYVVDVEADLAEIPRPRTGSFAFALAEKTAWIYDGAAWGELGEGGGGGAIPLAREQHVFAASDGANSQRLHWVETASNGAESVALMDGEDQYLVFAEESLWSVHFALDVTASGGDVTGIDLQCSTDGPPGLDHTFDAFFHVEPFGVWEGVFNFCWWFDPDAVMSFAPGFNVSAGSALASAALRLVRLA